MRGQSFSTMFVPSAYLIVRLTKLYDRVSRMEWRSLRFRIIKKSFHHPCHLPYFLILLCHRGFLNRSIFFALQKWCTRTGKKGVLNVEAIE